MTKVNHVLDWDRLRGDIADVQRPAAESEDVLRQARARFLVVAKERPRHLPAKRGPVLWAAVAMAAAVLLGIGGWVRYRSDTTLSFDTGAERSSGKVGDLLVAAEPLPVRFSDGTLLAMASATRARVTETSSHGATVVLEQGSIHAAVVHRSASKWHVAAGPFTVLITGTKFDIRWDAAQQTLALDLIEGAVTVLGPTLESTGRRVAPGESLRVSAASKPETVDATPSAPPDEAMRGSSSRESTGTSGPSTPWKQLALDERYADALRAAEAENFEALCRRASGADLLLLADAARFAGSTKRAEQAFRSVRSRFSGTHEAAMAAFTLGRIAHDERHSFREAVGWFQSYLREEPSGKVAREAAGRLIEAYRAAGDAAAARASAQTYLSKYPAGPHAGLARSIVNP
jgi:transmembrane sensor